MYETNHIRSFSELTWNLLSFIEQNHRYLPLYVSKVVRYDIGDKVPPHPLPLNFVDRKQ